MTKIRVDLVMFICIVFTGRAAWPLTHEDYSVEVATRCLVGLDGLEQGLEVSGAEALMVSALDDFEEKGGSVLKRLSEDLQQIALVIVVDENLLTLKDVDIFLHLEV